MACFIIALIFIGFLYVVNPGENRKSWKKPYKD
jgi:hypothetical protein